MKHTVARLALTGLVVTLALVGVVPSLAATAPPASGELLDAAKADAAAFKNEGATASIVEADGTKVLQAQFPAGKGYPGFNIPVPADGWDLSPFTGVQVDVTNTGASGVTVALRVDNEGDWQKGPWNTESASVGPGETKTIKVTFGKSYGGNPGYALDAAKVSALKVFAIDPKQPATVVIKNLKAFGTAPPRAPAAPAVKGVAPASSVLLPMTDDALKRLTPNSDQVTVARSQDAAAPGIVVTIQPGKEGYPGIQISPGGAPWDLSAYGHVEARVVNTGTKGISVALRVDNAGDWKDNPTNTESISLQPGKSGTVKTIFGYSYGHKPGYKLNPAAVTNMVLFAGKSDTVQSFRIESLEAGGPPGETPPVDPNAIRVKPQDGLLLGTGATIDAATQIAAKGAQAALAGATLRIVFPAAKGDQSVALKPAVGRWDLRDALQVRVKVKNDGPAPVTPRLRVESNGGPSDTITGAALAPGAEAEIVVPFISATIANLGQKGTGNRVTNDAVSAVTIMAENTEGERVLSVQSIKAELPPLDLPDWLGKRPPVDNFVEGDWVKTLDDEFDGTAVDDTVWNIYGPNYWDKTSHWSKDDVIVGDGVVRLRYEKKRGFHNDDPKGKESNYAAGFLESLGKWVQRYGYFESRMKLPRAPGLWPALWMMPDRGAASKNRQDTGNGGMEFDIMEHLTRWGPNRYNIAMHWDGYGKDHKSHGSDKIYVQPDKDGFITTGLLWTPGSAIYYANGKEVLRWEDPRVSNVPSDLMFTLPMGGWDNSPLDDAQLPDDFIIDYVRVWQRKDLASDADGKKAPAPPAAQPEAK